MGKFNASHDAHMLAIDNKVQCTALTSNLLSIIHVQYNIMDAL